MRKAYRTTWDSDLIDIAADFSQGSCEVEGTGGKTVSFFRHRPKEAMRYAIELAARADRLDLDDEGVQARISQSLMRMLEM